MRMGLDHRRNAQGFVSTIRLCALILIGSLVWTCPALAAEPASAPPVRVAVYDVAPYGAANPTGLYTGVSVDLWRRVADDLHLAYHFTLVQRMEDVLAGVEQGHYDVAIGAITITPERLDRVEFSYPAHRSGVAIAFRKGSGPLAALSAYGAVVGELGMLIGLTLGLLVAMGVLMWYFERPRLNQPHSTASAVTSLHEGIYWAVVTMTTVGYGDKTPITRVGRFIAVVWMMASLVLISLLTTSLVSQMTAQKVHEGRIASVSDLRGMRLAAVAESSGAEYLDSHRLDYSRQPDLKQALTALVRGKADAVVNSVGTLQYLISDQFPRTIAMPRGLLQPAFMAFALRTGSPLKKPIDRALIRITADPEWRKLEAVYFGNTD